MSVTLDNLSRCNMPRRHDAFGFGFGSGSSKRANQNYEGEQKYYRRKADGFCTRCGQRPPEPGNLKCQPCIDESQALVAQSNLAIRLACLEAYAGEAIDGKYVCACCGVRKRHEFLHIDHIGGDGAEHRRSLFGRRTGSIYCWLKRNNFPAWFQVLCADCNLAKGFYGVCPHQREPKGSFEQFGLLAALG